MLGVVKNTTNPSEYSNQSYNEHGINYLSLTDNKRHKFNTGTFGNDLLKEFFLTQSTIE